MMGPQAMMLPPQGGSMMGVGGVGGVNMGAMQGPGAGPQQGMGVRPPGMQHPGMQQNNF